MALTVARTQIADGSFAVLPARPPIEASRFTSTALSIRALQLYDAACDSKVNKAREWLMRAQPRSQEERSMRLLGLTWSNAGVEDIAKASADLLAQQRPDGGWAQISGIESDAYATGQAMVALHEAGILLPSDPAYKRGLAFLLRTQMPDGSWLVRTRSSPFQPLKESGFPHGRNQWISAAGTSWAAMALALSEPAKEVTISSGVFRRNPRPPAIAQVKPVAPEE
jgi:hypothetical protein